MDEKIKTLQNTIHGEVITESSPEYTTLKKSFIFEGHPLLIVLVKTQDDIAKSIQFARENQLVLSVRSGGHGFSGLSTNEGGMVIDLAHFNEVVIDEDLTFVRVGAGARWGDVAETLRPYGLAISSGDTTSVGVGGLTLGGGVGWQVRNMGLTIDNLEKAEIVTADGATLQVSKTENPDLFWAIRGGGGNFGVVTSFTFRAHDLKQVLKGMVMYPVSELESVLTKWARVMDSAPEALNATFVAIPGFGPEPVPALMILFCCAADDEPNARKAVQPLLELGKPEHSDVKLVAYADMLEEAIPPQGIKTFAQTGFIKKLDATNIKTIAQNYGRVGTAILQIRRLGGAMSRIASDETAFAWRNYDALIWSVSPVPEQLSDEEGRAISEKSWAPIKPLTEGGYVNFLSSADHASVTLVYPPETYARLAKIKAMYDPENIFCRDINIEPAK